MPARSRSTKILIGSCLLLSGSVTGSAPAFAGDLVLPFCLENAETLPAGIRNPRFINVFGGLQNKFGDDGSVQGLGEPLNKIVHWGDVMKEQEDDAKRTTARGLLIKNGINENGSAGSTSGEVNTFANVKVAALAWGVTDKLTIAGALPIVHIDVSASTGFIANGDGKAFVASAARDSTPQLAAEATGQFNDAVNRKLIRLGYQPIPSSETISGVGDAQLIGKYRLYDDGVNGVALKGTLVFPTGTAADPDKALDIPTGDGRLGIGMAGIYDRHLPWSFRWNSYASYTAMLPHHVVKRVPTSVEDPLSADKEEMYERTRNLMAVGTGLEHLFTSTGILLGGGYSFQYMTHADYEPGTTYGADRYALLGDQQPLEALHSVLVSAGFSTIDWYKHKRFVYPMQVSFSYMYPFAGRNVPSNGLMAGELVLFF